MTTSVAKVDALIDKYGPEPGSLILVLQDVMAELGYLPREVLDHVGARLGVSSGRVYHVATFYNAFSLTPKGRHRVHVCMGTACHVRGAAMIRDKVCRDLKVESGGTTKDGEWSVDEVNCVGACAMGPVVVVDGDVHGQMTQAKFDKVLKVLRAPAEGSAAPAPAPAKPAPGKPAAKPAAKPVKKSAPKKPAKKGTKPAPKKAVKKAAKAAVKKTKKAVNAAARKSRVR
jgi:NADH-quinone oxidoreductase subunit E